MRYLGEGKVREEVAHRPSYSCLYIAQTHLWEESENFVGGAVSSLSGYTVVLPATVMGLADVIWNSTTSKTPVAILTSKLLKNIYNHVLYMCM